MERDFVLLLLTQNATESRKGKWTNQKRWQEMTVSQSSVAREKCMLGERGNLSWCCVAQGCSVEVFVVQYRALHGGEGKGIL